MECEVSDYIKATVARMKMAGHSNKHIAEVLKISKTTADKYVRLAGLSTYKQDKERRDGLLSKVVELRSNGLSYNEIACELDISHTTVVHYANKAGLRTRRDTSELLKLYDEIVMLKRHGLSTKAIADKVGAPYGTVRTYLKRAGYETRTSRILMLRVNKSVLEALKAPADARGVRPKDLAERIIRIAAEDKLVGSILDDGVEP